MIVPGSPSALMLAAAADPLDNILAIGHSTRLRRSASGHFTRTPSGGGNRDLWTLDLHIKRGMLGRHTVYAAGTSGGGSYDAVYFTTSDKLEIDIGGATRLISTEVFRDVAAHLNLRIDFDAANATAAHRIRVYVNGREITAWDSDARASQTTGTAITNTAVAHWLGTMNGYSGIYDYLDGYLSYVRLTDGVVPNATAFSVSHPVTSQWRPKRYTGTYGTNGFHLDFSDGSAATSSTLGKDRSGNNNDWTPTNISVTAGVTNDWLLDTPTNNFAVLDALRPPVASSWNASTLSNGNLRATAQAGVYNAIGFSTMPVFTDRITQVEMKAGGIGSAGHFGINKITAPVANPFGATGIGYRSTDGNKSIFGVVTAYGAAWTTETIGVICDPGAATITFYKNGVSQGAISAPSIFDGTFVIAGGLDDVGSHYIDFNFGQRAFDYPISGAKNLCTKNLTKPTTLAKSTNSFVAVTDSGANVQTTLATARAGWTNYIEIFKRREAAEGWRWRFSSDLANYLDSSSTAAKAAFPSLTGTSYVGYALRVSPSCGVATGTFVHVNGVLDTITDGLGNVRKMVLLKREDSTSDWLVYHPDLTAGKLLYLNLTSAETVDTSIGTVLSNSFVAAAALASGTYRWMALAEVDGFLKLSKWIANAIADGPFSAGGFLPQLMICKPTNLAGAGDGWMLMDGVRMPYNAINPAAVANQPNTTAGEGTRDSGFWQSSGLDFVSNGIKIRNSNGEMNGTVSDIIVGVSFAAFPFRYANAR